MITAQNYSEPAGKDQLLSVSNSQREGIYKAFVDKNHEKIKKFIYTHFSIIKRVLEILWH